MTKFRVAVFCLLCWAGYIAAAGYVLAVESKQVIRDHVADTRAAG